MSLWHDAAFQSFVPRLVPPRLLTRAHARFDQSDAVAQTSGPALSGGLIALVGAPAAVLFDSASYLLSALLLSRVRVVEPPRASLRIAGVGREAREGLRWVYRHATLRPLAVWTHLWFLFMAVAGAIVAPFALRSIGLSPLGFGLAMAAAGVGGLVGSLRAVRLGARFGAGRVVIASRFLTALAWTLVAASSDRWSGWLLFGAGQFVLGAGIGVDNANSMGYRQMVTPDALQGRMNATMRSINRAMIVIGAPVGGALGDAFGFRSMLWVSVAGFVVVACALGISKFRHARVGDAYTLLPGG
jgi:predicted MFS family arabinose efflux permease